MKPPIDAAGDGPEFAALTINRALWVVADTRIIDLAQILGITTSGAEEFRVRCWKLYEARQEGTA